MAPTLTECPRCDAGRVDCHNCRGAGCPRCGNRGWEMCDCCSGQGVVPQRDMEKYWLGEEAALAIIKPRTPSIEKALAEARAELRKLNPEDYDDE